MQNEALKHALAWAERGFCVFPLSPGGKKPLISNYTEESTTDPSKIASWWRSRFYGSNIGVAVRYPLVVIDVDVKNNRAGLSTLLNLGVELDTLTVQTPSGGYHLYYYDFASEYRNTSHTQGPLRGLDIRSHGAMVLAPGSHIDGRVYKIAHDGPVQPLPDILRREMSVAHDNTITAAFTELDHPRNIKDATHYLIHNAPLAVSGAGGNNTAYSVAAHVVNDLALSEDTAVALMLEHWNPRCMPPWDAGELEAIVANARRYAKGSLGVATTQAAFGGLPAPPPAPPYVAAYGADRGFVAAGGVPVSALAPAFGNWLPRASRRPTRWVVRDLLASGHCTVICAPGGAGKSTQALSWAAHIAAARDVSARLPVDRSGRVLVWDFEDTRAFMSAKLEVLANEGEIELTSILPNMMLAGAEDEPFAITDDAGNVLPDRIAAMVDLLRENEVVAAFFTPLDCLHSANEIDNTRMRKVMRALNKIAADADTAICLMHHTPKSNGRYPMEHGDTSAFRGGSTITNAARHALTLLHIDAAEAEQYGVSLEERRRYTRLQIAKSNIGPDTIRPFYWCRTDVPVEDGNSIPVFQPHQFEASFEADERIIGGIINAIMVENMSGEAKQLDVIERWREADPVRSVTETSILERALFNLYRRKNAFFHIDSHGRTLVYKRVKQGRITKYQIEFSPDTGTPQPDAFDRQSA